MTDGDVTGAVAPPSSPKERRLKLALIASLAVNFLVIGAVASAMFFAPHGPRHGGGRGEDYGLMAFTRVLSHDRRAPIRKTIKEQREVFKAMREDIDAARRQAAEVLVAEPFSREKMKEALGKVNDADLKLKTAAQDMLLKISETLTPEERQALKTWWEKRRGHRFRRGDDGPPPKDDGPPEAAEKKSDAP